MNTIRRKALLKMLAGLGSFAGICAVFLYFHLQGNPLNPKASLIAALPMGFGFVGFLEFASNRPLSEMEAWWGSLKGWQRGLIGGATVLMAFAGFIAFLAFAGKSGMLDSF